MIIDRKGTTIDTDRADWRKATRSGGGDNCVEVAFVDGNTAVRDSKDPQGGVLVYTPGEWDAFIDGAKNGEFDRK